MSRHGRTPGELGHHEPKGKGLRLAARTPSRRGRWQQREKSAPPSGTRDSEGRLAGLQSLGTMEDARNAVSV